MDTNILKARFVLNMLLTSCLVSFSVHDLVGSGYNALERVSGISPCYFL